MDLATTVKNIPLRKKSGSTNLVRKKPTNYSTTKLNE